MIVRTATRRSFGLRRLNTLTSAADLNRSERSRGSAVVLLHLGEPNDQNYLKSRLSAYLELKRWKFLGPVAEFFPQFQILQRRLNASFTGPAGQFRNVVEAQQRLLLPTLNQLLPELAPFRCISAFAFAKPTIEEAIVELRRNPADRVFLLPLYPHYWCFQSGTCINRVTSELLRTSSANDHDENLRSFTGTAEQFQESPPTRWSLIDRWPVHPSLTDAYGQLITKELRYFPYDVERSVALLFCAPVRTGFDVEEYNREIIASCLRIAEAVGGSHPYRLAFFQPWDKVLPSMPRCNQLLSTVRQLVKQNRPNILVVPLSHVANCYDTDEIVPKLLQDSQLKKAGAHHIRILSAPNDSPVFIQGLAELIKNHHGNGAKSSAQYSLKCHNCSNPLCQQSRSIFDSQ